MSKFIFCLPIMFEVEVKAKCDDLEQLKVQLIQRWCSFSASVKQDDRIYIPAGKVLDGLLPGENALRIRTVTKPDGSQRHLYTLKQQICNDLAKHERETAIEDPHQMHDMILMMGYILSSEVHKTRQKANYQDMEICLDTVEWLGSFIELEKLVEDGDADQIQESLFVYLESLGIQRTARATKGYDVMLYEQHMGS